MSGWVGNREFSVEETAMKKTIIFLTVFLVSGVIGCTPQNEYVGNAIGNLKYLGMSLRMVGVGTNAGLVACTPRGGTAAEIVSAETILRPLLADDVPPEVFVSAAYKERVPPRNVQGTSALEKWGSSFNMWCMAREKWETVGDFFWRSDDEQWTLSFPWMWDKRPDLHGGVVCVSLGDGTARAVPISVFETYIAAARRWVSPTPEDIEKAISELESPEIDTRVSALRHLGIWRATNHTARVESFLRADEDVLRESAAWALGRIGDPAAIGALADLKGAKLYLREIAVDALGRIGGPPAANALVEFYNDPAASVRKGVVEAIANIHSEAVMPLLLKALKDEDASVRAAAAEAVRRAGE